jgi:hypothetical protein
MIGPRAGRTVDGAGLTDQLGQGGQDPLGDRLNRADGVDGHLQVVNGPHLVALVRAGARFDKGVMVERPDDVQEVAA